MQVDYSTGQYHGWLCLPDRASQSISHHPLYVQVQLRKVPSKCIYIPTPHLATLGSLTIGRVMQMNRLQDLTPAPSMTMPIEHSSRPTLGFPLGTALLLLVIFSLSGMFSCCYHWDKLRSLLRSRHPAMFQEGEHTVISITSSPSKETSDHKLEKVGKECGLPVIMPGDKVPKFFAKPCPHEICFPEVEKTEVPLETKCSVHETISICTPVDESTLSR
ncbi:unnamed protein product [Urochloa decumbens]|uniref:Uncharacterized protein n=1 Tax=Urochloa decumbens TaxID=240449 RepID=A0ABC8X5C1_9POAL